MSDLTPNDTVLGDGVRNESILPQQWRWKANTFDYVRVRVQMSDLTPNDMTPNDTNECQS